MQDEFKATAIPIAAATSLSMLGLGMIGLLTCTVVTAIALTAASMLGDRRVVATNQA